MKLRFWRRRKQLSLAKPAGLMPGDKMHVLGAEDFTPTERWHWDGFAWVKTIGSQGDR